MAVALAGLAFGAYKLISGGIKEHKAKEQAAEDAKNRPIYNINPNVGSEVALAQNELSNGIGSDATRAYEEGIDKDLSGSLDAILKSGGTPNNVADVFSNSEEGRQRLALMKDNLRLNQINTLVNAYRNQTNETDKAFQFNRAAPFFDKVQANADARKSAEAEQSSGFDTIGSSVLGYLENKRQENLYDKYFGTGKDTYVPTHNPGIVSDTSLVPIQNAYNLTTAAPQTIDMNLQPSIVFPQTQTAKYNLPQNFTL